MAQDWPSRSSSRVARLHMTFARTAAESNYGETNPKLRLDRDDETGLAVQQLHYSQPSPSRAKLLIHLPRLRWYDILIGNPRDRV